MIGEFARTPRYQGAGSSQVNPTRVDVALDELRAAVPDGVEVAFAAGFGIGTHRRRRALAAEAVALAGGADVVVAFLGLPDDDESEGFDREHMDLPANQTALLARLAAANPNLVVVLANGSAVQVSDWEQHAGDPRVLAVRPGRRRRDRRPAPRRGQPVRPARRDHAAAAGGQPVLPQLPRRVRARPLRRGRLRRLPRLRRRSTATSATRSGTACRTPPSTTATSPRPSPAPRPTATWPSPSRAPSPTPGRAPGKEVVQLYVGDLEASVARPVRELKAFTKVGLEPGASETVTFDLTERDLSYWSTADSVGCSRPASSRSPSAPRRATCASHHARHPRAAAAGSARRHGHAAGSGSPIPPDRSRCDRPSAYIPTDVRAESSPTSTS